MNTKIIEAAALFPETFGLRAFPGKVFRISLTSSFMSDGAVVLYTQVAREGEWYDFAKGSPAELIREVVAL